MSDVHSLPPPSGAGVPRRDGAGTLDISDIVAAASSAASECILQKLVSLGIIPRETPVDYGVRGPKSPPGTGASSGTTGRKKKKKGNGGTIPVSHPVHNRSGSGGKSSVSAAPLAAPAGKQPLSAPRDVSVRQSSRPFAESGIRPSSQPVQPTLWSQVVGRRAKRRKPPATGPIPTVNRGNLPSPPKPLQGGKKGGNTGAAGRPRRRRAPTTAAVVINGPTDGYAELMARIKREIPSDKVRALGLRPRWALTGAMVLEARGPDRDQIADTLAKDISGLFKDLPDVRVTRPRRTADIRLTGLEPSVTQEEVAEAIARETRCPPSDIRVGAIKPSPRPRGMSTVLVSCPIDTANKIARGGRLQLRLVSAGVELLKARPLQCFRCLEGGHVRAKCTNADRSDICYRCGSAGHVAANCDAPASCAVCQAAGRPHLHRLGGPACKPPRKKGKGGQTPASAPPFPPSIITLLPSLGELTVVEVTPKPQRASRQKPVIVSVETVVPPSLTDTPQEVVSQDAGPVAMDAEPEGAEEPVALS